MKRLHCLGLLCVCLGIAAMLLLRAGEPAIAASQSGCGSWNYVPSPNPTNTHNILDGVDTIAPDDVWAVGGFYGTSQAFIEHWDGSQWRIIANPVPANSALNAVVAISSTDVWAAGSYSNSNSNQTLIEHWNGTTWSVVPSPGPGNGPELFGMAANSANDIWAVGEYFPGNKNYGSALIEHWNGSQWSVVPSPTSIPNAQLNSVSALSTNNVWAVGTYNPRLKKYTLVEHWDGSQWSVIPSPNPSLYKYLNFAGVAAASASNVWAVGNYGDNADNTPLIEHWNGKKWTIVASPAIAGGLSGIVAISDTNIWAVGSDGNTLTEHWNGMTWSIVPSPDPGGYGNNFYAVANVPGSNYIWAVGDADYQEPTGSYLDGTLTTYYC